MCSETYWQAVCWPENFLVKACLGIAMNTLTDEFEIIERNARRVARRVFGYIICPASWRLIHRGVLVSLS